MIVAAWLIEVEHVLLAHVALLPVPSYRRLRFRFFLNPCVCTGESQREETRRAGIQIQKQVVPVGHFLGAAQRAS